MVEAGRNFGNLEPVEPQPSLKPFFSEDEVTVINRLIAGIPCKEPNLWSARANLKQRYLDGSGREPLLLAVAEAVACGLVNFDNLLEKPAEPLSERQEQIWKLLGQGYFCQKIAETLKTSYESIDSSSHFLFCRLGVANRFGAVAMRVKMEQTEN